MKPLRIGELSRELGLPAATIRFYERAGILPQPPRNGAGYRAYSPLDLRRVRLAKRLRALGVSLAEMKRMVSLTLDLECAEYTDQLGDLIRARLRETDAQIAMLSETKRELQRLQRHLRHAQRAHGRRVADCDYCPLIDTRERRPRGEAEQAGMPVP